MEAQARRPRLPEGLRRIPGGHEPHRAADGHPREDDQGLQPRVALRRSQRDPPDEEDDPGRPQGVPRRHADPDLRRAARGRSLPSALLPPGQGPQGDPVHARAPRGPRWRRPVAPRAARLAQAAGRRRLQAAEEGLRQAGDRHDHGVRPAAQGPHARQGVRLARGADHPRRGAHLRDGLVLPDHQDLQPARAELHTGRRRADARLPRVREGADPPPRDRRGRLDGRVHGGRHVVCHARRADGADLRLLLDVRVPADRRTRSGRRPTR